MQNEKGTHERSFLVYVNEVLKQKKTLAAFAVVGAVVGIVYAFAQPRSYSSDVVLAPEVASGSGMSESLASMASSFGLDLGKNSSIDALYPEIYPTLMSSTDFILKLFDVKVTLSDGRTKTYYKHLVQDTKMPFWNYPISWLKRQFAKKKKAAPAVASTDGPIKLSVDDAGLVSAIRSSISCVVLKKTNVITIEVTDQDPQVAAILADTLQKRLQSYITDYRTHKARNDVNYYQKLYNESRTAYLNAQHAYATYADANEDVVLQVYASKRDELENEMQIKYDLYSQVNVQLQRARAQLQESTPAFTVLQSATVPIRPSSMPRTYVALMFLVAAVVLDVAWVLYGRRFVKRCKRTKKNNPEK